ncbi:MAG: hypothetical protein ABFD79_12580 [Phycisphaerales bacterium]
MKVKTITLEGETGFKAIISREVPSQGPECIFSEIIDNNGDRIAIHHVMPDDKDDQFSLAECIQFQLDGCRGTNSMIHDYMDYIKLFAD